MAPAGPAAVRSVLELHRCVSDGDGHHRQDIAIQWIRVSDALYEATSRMVLRINSAVIRGDFLATLKQHSNVTIAVETRHRIDEPIQRTSSDFKPAAAMHSAGSGASGDGLGVVMEFEQHSQSCSDVVHRRYIVGVVKARERCEA